MKQFNVLVSYVNNFESSFVNITTENDVRTV